MLFVLRCPGVGPQHRTTVALPQEVSESLGVAGDTRNVGALRLGHPVQLLDTLNVYMDRAITGDRRGTGTETTEKRVTTPRITSSTR
jgi:hypothetical protein